MSSAAGDGWYASAAAWLAPPLAWRRLRSAQQPQAGRLTRHKGLEVGQAGADVVDWVVDEDARVLGHLRCRRCKCGGQLAGGWGHTRWSAGPRGGVSSAAG